MGSPSLQQDLQQITAIQARLPGYMVVLIGVAAATVVLLPPLWVASKYLYTMTHEGGHAFMGSLVGLQITSVTMESNGNGLTSVTGQRGLGVILFQFFGYLAPGTLGVGTAKLIQLGHIVAVLWLLLLALAVLLLCARGLVAWACIIGAGFLLYNIVRYGTVGTKVFTAYVLTWFLLISGVVMVLRHWRNEGDRALLKTSTGLPKWFWPPLWLVGSIAALIIGGRLLV